MTGQYVLVTSLVTWDGEQQHPMDTIVTKVDLDDAGNPTPEAMERLAERIRRDVVQKVARSGRPAAGRAEGVS